MSVRGGWRPLSEFVFRIIQFVNSVGQGNSTFFKKNSGNLKNFGL